MAKNGRRGGSPPIEYQFQPGTSGCPNGRRGNKGPALATGYDSRVLSALDRLVPLPDGSEVSLLERMLERDALEAANGNDKSVARMTREYARASANMAELISECLAFHVEVSEAFAQAEADGVPPPDFTPHPAHVVITDEGVQFIGPLTREDRAKWEFIKHQMRFFSDGVAAVRRLQKERPSPELLRVLRFARAQLESWRRKIPQGWNWKEQIYTRDSSPEEITAFEKRLIERARRHGAH